MNDKKLDGVRMFRMIHGLGDGKRNDAYDEGWEDAIEACEGAVTELYGVDHDDAYPNDAGQSPADEDAWEKEENEDTPCPICNLFDLLEQLLDTMPRNDFDRGWNNAVKACINTFAEFLAGEDDDEPCAGDGLGEEDSDPVNHPAHYCDGGIETLDFILAKRLDFLLGQVVKYVSRAGKKDPSKELQDLKKAQFYLNRKIELMENAE